MQMHNAVVSYSCSSFSKLSSFQ